jgi:hypothetical protein
MIPIRASSARIPWDTPNPAFFLVVFHYAYALFVLRFCYDCAIQVIVLFRDIPNRTTAGVLAYVFACIDVLLLSDFR